MAFPLFLLSLVSSAVADELLFVQAVWRHGDRTPSQSYPSDPYNTTFWKLPEGELTKIGMKQQFVQGKRLRKIYIEDLKFLPSTYYRDDVVVRSATEPRCLQSAESNLAGFYSSSPTHPSDVPSWPSDWTPIPIHSVPVEEDLILETGAKCERMLELTKEREATVQFANFLANNWMIFATFSANGGGQVAPSYISIHHLWKSCNIEKKYHNLTLPSWITDSLYNQLGEAERASRDFVNGAEGFGLEEETELVKLRGGFLLKEWIANLEEAGAGGKYPKYKAYSAHDSTIVALLHTLGAKFSLLDREVPEFAATLITELWRRNGEMHVKFVYLPDAFSTERTVTSLVRGCPKDSDFCPLSTLKKTTEKHIANNKDCL